MFRSKNPGQGLLAVAILSTTIISCSREKMIEESSVDHIAASEKLSIPTLVELPANSPGGNTRVATFFAKGVQIYKAKEKTGSDPLTYEWAFVAPQAKLYDPGNKIVGSHGAGPFWTLSGSDSIFAQAFNPAKSAPAPDASSIDWLLLMPKTGTVPKGIFAGVAYIQRIATKGGKAPAYLPENASSTIEIPYEAVYRFTKKNP